MWIAGDIVDISCHARVIITIIANSSLRCARYQCRGIDRILVYLEQEQCSKSSATVVQDGQIYKQCGVAISGHTHLRKLNPSSYLSHNNLCRGVRVLQRIEGGKAYRFKKKKRSYERLCN